MMWFLLSVLAAFAAVVAFRAWRFRPAPHQRAQAEPLEVDEAAVGERLRAMVRLPTVSDRDAQRMDAEAFERFRALLKAQYPGVGAACSWESAGRNGLMIRWPGRGQAAPSVLMAHYDVVPADAAEFLSLLRGLVDALIAHLNELIQVGGDDGEKLGALQKRIVGIVRFFLYSPVKRKPTQFAVLDGVPLCFAFVPRTHIPPSFHAPCKSVIYHYSTSKKRLSTLDAHRTAFSSFPSATGKACMPETGTDRSRHAPRRGCRGLRTGLIRRVFMPAAPGAKAAIPLRPAHR